ncbi:CpaF family protein [Georgenia sp. Z1491]|uniref:CpaF family protein n=1 Tax=Georgenia sp. Z1491 TaxID=3416707 RepID=UPI003CF5ED5E
MTDPLALLESEVRELVRRRDIDPAREPDTTRTLAVAAAAEFEERSTRGLVPPLADVDAAIKHVMDAVVGLGPLQALLDDPEVEELWINEPGKVFAARHGRAELTTVLLDTQQVRDLVERMLRSSGRRIDLSSPFVDAALPGGERLHVVIPEITREHWAVNIRKYLVRARSLDDLVQRGSLSPHAARVLDGSVRAGLNVLVSGATQAGKTTMLAALCGSIPATQRVVTVEEVFELNLARRDVVAMQTRQPNLEGSGEIPLRRLVKESLRMRPDRIIVGEVREAEAFDLLVALNAGLPGAATLHANSAREAVAKLCTLPLLAGENVTSDFTVPTVATSVDLVVHLDLDHTGRRTVREIVHVTGRVEGGVVETSRIFERRGERLVRASGHIGPDPRFDRAGLDVAALLAES